MTELYVLHIDKQKTPEAEPDLPKGCLGWETCLRKIYVSTRPMPAGGAELYWGSDAYEFLLQVASGLCSPILGETEVFGQFKEFVKSSLVSSSKIGQELSAVFQSLIKDIKQLRSEHLIGVGNQSYGSLLRKLVPRDSRVTVLGAGKLAAEISPWLQAKSAGLEILCRSEARVNESLRSLAKIRELQVGTRYEFDVLVIAAPVSDRELRQMAERANIVLDLREWKEERRSPVEAKAYHDLKDFFQQFELQGKVRQQTRADAQKLARQLAQAYQNRIVVRPFGWEDLCG